MLKIFPDVKVEKAKEKKFVPMHDVVAIPNEDGTFTANAVLHFLEPTSTEGKETEAFVPVCDKVYNSAEEVAQAVTNKSLDAPAKLISYITTIEEMDSDFLSRPVLVQLGSGEYAVVLTHDPDYDGVTPTIKKIKRIISGERWLDFDSAKEVVERGLWTNVMEYEIPHSWLSLPEIEIYEDDSGYYFARKIVTQVGIMNGDAEEFEHIYEGTSHRYETPEIAEQELQNFLQLIKYQ